MLRLQMAAFTSLIPPTSTSLHGSFLSDEQFQCSICLDVFTNPSSTPCGHSFCMRCISRYWDGLKVCQCPLCKKTFHKRPDLQINRTLREITEQFRSMRGAEGGEGGGGGGGGGGGVVGRERKGSRGGGGAHGAMPGNLMRQLKKKMHRSLHNCEDQFQDHSTQLSCAAVTTVPTSLVPNLSPVAALDRTSASPPPFTRPSGRRRFTVSGAASSHHLPVCDIHHRGILIYCRTDQACVCPDCETADHPDHETVTIEDEWMETKAQLHVSEQNIQEMIRQRFKKIEEIRASLTELELAVERETTGSVCLFSALVSAIEHSQAELMEVMEMSCRAAEHQAKAMIRQLELEVEDLQTRQNALAALDQSDDHIHCVRTFPIITSLPPAKDWSRVSLNSDLGTGTIYRSLLTLVERFQAELKDIAETGFPSSDLELSPLQTQPRAKTVQEYAADVTLDSNTAHPRLILSEDMKSVRCGDRHQQLPANAERFDRVVCVLGREAISSGRHYWEVEVTGKTDWDLGVARQSVVRKGKLDVTPSNGFWFLSLRDKSRYAIRSEPHTDVHLSLHPQKVGIFVDFDEGQVSFYNVDAKVHIYTFSDTFTESIYPFFSPCTNKSGKNDGPLIITPINLAD